MTASRPYLMPVVVLLLLAGTLYRLWPAVYGMPELATFFVSEDGYLLLTVARNLGIGQGMAVSDGEILTNGIQPLVTFLFTVPYWATGGDKVTSLAWVHVIATVIALCGAFAIRALAARLLAPRDPDPAWPWAVALLWFLGPLMLRHSMNGLETGLVTAMIALTLVVLHRRLAAGAEAGLGLDLALGAVVGLTILARIDTGVLAVLVFGTWALWVALAERQPARVLTRIVPAGLVTTVIAGPWFARNLLVFGDLMPISGDSQKLSAVFGQNLPLLPAKLFELAFPMAPLPGVFERSSLLQIALLVVLALILCLFIWRLVARTPRPAAATALVGLGYLGFLAYYYGAVFGTPHFFARYLAPMAPLMIIAALAAALEVGRWLPSRLPVLAIAYAAGGLALSLVLLGLRLGPLAIPQGHENTIAWTDANVDDATWVGAPQTGTLGYWHDRTINLDGKTNPAALAARETEGHVLDYVVDSRIDYVIDWAGVGGWVDFEEAQGPGGFAEAFELILQDEARNLSVMARRDREK